MREQINKIKNFGQFLNEQQNNDFLYHGTSLENALNIIENGFDENSYWGDYDTAQNYAYSYTTPTLIKVNKKDIIDLLEPNYTLINYHEDNIDDIDSKEVIDIWNKSTKTTNDSLSIFDSAILAPSYINLDNNNIVEL